MPGIESAMVIPVLHAKRVFGTNEALWVRNGHDEQTVPWSRVTGVDKVGVGAGAFLCHGDVQGDDRGVSFVGSAALLEQFERFRRGEKVLPADHDNSSHAPARRALYAEPKHAWVRAGAATALTCSALSLIVIALRGAPASELILASLALFAQAVVFTSTVWATRRLWIAPEGLYASGPFSDTERLYPWSDIGPCDSPAWAFVWPLSEMARFRLRNSRVAILFFAVPGAQSAIEGGRTIGD